MSEKTELKEEERSKGQDYNDKNNQSTWRAIAAGSMLAISSSAIGLLVGLSESPVIEGVITSLLTLLTASLIGKRLLKREEKIDVLPYIFVAIITLFLAAGALGGLRLRKTPVFIETEIFERIFDVDSSKVAIIDSIDSARIQTDTIKNLGGFLEEVESINNHAEDLLEKILDEIEDGATPQRIDYLSRDTILTNHYGKEFYDSIVVIRYKESLKEFEKTAKMKNILESLE